MGTRTWVKVLACIRGFQFEVPVPATSGSLGNCSNADSQSHSNPLSQSHCRQAPYSVTEEGLIKRKPPELVEGAQQSCKNSEPRALPADSSQLMVTCGVTMCKLGSVGSYEKWAYSPLCSYSIMLL